jgi:hypothetical protein
MNSTAAMNQWNPTGAARGLPPMDAGRDAVPVKTERARQELGRRRGELRPRLRSLLLLADGQRSLAHLAEMAARIGASADDLDTLLRDHFLELPAEPEPAPTPAPMVAATEPPDPLPPPTATASVSAPVQATEPAAPAALAAAALLPASAATPEATDTARLESARALLLDWLSADGGHLRLREWRRQVQAAETAESLVDLVVALEGQIRVANCSHAGRLCQQQLHELLGLGNTRVSEEALAWADDDEDDEWSPTRPGGA